jgi:hypothetical protein
MNAKARPDLEGPPGNAPVRVDAIVTDREHDVLVAVVEQLRACLSSAAESTWPVEFRLLDSPAAIASDDLPSVVVMSLLPELDRGDEPHAATEARWREQLAALPAGTQSSALLCTIFRHVDGPSPESPIDARPAIRERIRRLNLMAIELSHDAGVGVIDIDRAFAQQGARLLQTDHRLGGPVAAKAAAHAIVAGILRMLPEDVVGPRIVERAQALHGDLRDMAARG